MAPALGPSPISRLFDLVVTKLFGDNYDPNNSQHSLALLSMRFSLSLRFGHREAVAVAETAVADHMRVCVGISDDRTHLLTQYPSEPFLAFVAAIVLHTQIAWDGAMTKQDTPLAAALNGLCEKVETGVVDQGRLQELISRLLLLLCKDYMIMKMHPDIESWLASEPDINSVLPFCKGIPLLEYLKELLGKHVVVADAERLFSKALVHFSHWIAVDQRISQMESASRYDLVSYKTSRTQVTH